jgi:prophage antirepressor-like protein/transposase-like protein
MSSSPIYKIHTYDNNYCLNDVVTQCNISTNPKEYIASISDKINYNSQFYLSKDKLFDILSKSKAPKSKELLQYLNDTNTMKDKLELVDLNKKNNMLINFVDYKQSFIQFNNKQLKYFVHNNQFYFKAKDVANILDYSNSKQAIIVNVDESDKNSIYNFLLNEENRGVYGIDPPQKGSLATIPLNGTLENNKNKIEPNILKNISDIYDKIKNEDLQTIFINESGLYSLILSSKKEEAKVFKKWVTSEVLPSIRKNGSYISKKLVEYNKDEMKKYKNKDCVYILHIKDNIYKYGKTSKIEDRFYKHKQNLEYTNIEKIYVLDSINDTNILESDIKEFTKINKLNMYYNNGIEYFESNSNNTIDKIIEKIDELYKKIRKNINNTTELLLDKIFDKLNELDSKMIKMEMSLNKPQINITSTKSSKCIDCMNIISDFATRCGDCDKKNKLKVSIMDENKPSLAQLQKDLKELRFVSQVARKYNVTPRTINKWTDNYDKYNKQKQAAMQPAPQPTAQQTVQPGEVQPEDDKKKKCLDCDKLVYKKCTRCNDCNNKYKIKTNSETTGRPSLDQLKNDLKELKSMVQVGIKYKVSDNAIRKWIRNYEKII